MSTISVLLGLPQKGTRIARNITKAGITAAIFLDATLREGFDAPSEVTQHPVEKGVDISDHVILRPQKLSISGKFSETPFSIEAQAAGVASTVASTIGQNLGGALGGAGATFAASKTLAGVLKPKSITGGSVIDQEGNFREENNLPSENSRLRDAVAELTNLRESRQPVTIITGLKQYENYMLSGFKVSRDQSTGQSINVDLEFTEFKVAQSETVRIPIPKTPKALKKADQGRKNATGAKRETSILGRISQKIF